MAEEKKVKFTFIGNPKNPSDQRDEVTFDGITFKRGEANEVSDPKVIKKLRGNTHFAEDGKKAPEDKRTEVAKANQRPVDPRDTVVPSYKDADTPRAAQQQGAGESGFGYNEEAEEADRQLAAETRAKEQEALRAREPRQEKSVPKGR
jgi:hypothetical protein